MQPDLRTLAFAHDDGVKAADFADADTLQAHGGTGCQTAYRVLKEDSDFQHFGIGVVEQAFTRGLTVFEDIVAVSVVDG